MDKKLHCSPQHKKQRPNQLRTKPCVLQLLRIFSCVLSCVFFFIILPRWLFNGSLLCVMYFVYLLVYFIIMCCVLCMLYILYVVYFVYCVQLVGCYVLSCVLHRCMLYTLYLYVLSRYYMMCTLYIFLYTLYTSLLLCTLNTFLCTLLLLYTLSLIKKTKNPLSQNHD